MAKRRISVQDIRQALLDERFRASLPESLIGDVQEFLKNPGCACNHSIYLRVMRQAAKQLADYYPAREAPSPEEAEREVEKVSRNNWQVINCNVRELEAKLRELGPGRKQLEIARWQDEATVIVNHLEGVL